jgi:hypothetical protein
MSFRIPHLRESTQQPNNRFAVGTEGSQPTLSLSYADFVSRIHGLLNAVQRRFQHTDFVSVCGCVALRSRDLKGLPLQGSQSLAMQTRGRRRS